MPGTRTPCSLAASQRASSTRARYRATSAGRGGRAAPTCRRAPSSTSSRTTIRSATAPAASGSRLWCATRRRSRPRRRCCCSRRRRRSCSWGRNGRPSSPFRGSAISWPSSLRAFTRTAAARIPARALERPLAARARAVSRPGRRARPRRRADAAERHDLVIPRATYRLQLNAGFTFRDATALVPYLASLGVSHVYCSPYFRARAGSTHGYDVVDHNSFNPEIGDRADFEEFVAALRSHGMGHVVDIVPNHVGIGADNAWWMDVLENGEASIYASFFDLDWAPSNPDRAHKVLVPVLAAPYGTVLERGELELRFEPQWGSFAVHYFEHRLPLDPRTYPRILDRVPALLASTELENIRRSLAALPDRHSLGPEQVAERNREKELHKRRLSALAAGDSAVAGAIETAARSFAGTAAEPASFDTLHELLELQAWHLAHWRVAADDINYRRFFDVNDLAGLRVENEAVFEHTHRLLLQLIAAGRIDGLRIDHADGLYDPAGYFRRLQQRIAELTGRRGARALYLVVEKITASFEHLPDDWPVHGETGYRFANVVNRMLVDSATRTRMDRAYRQFIDEPLEWREVAYP